MGTALLNRDRYGQGKAIPKDASGAGTNWGNGIQSDDPFANVRRQGCLRHKKLENYSTPARRGLQDVHRAKKGLARLSERPVKRSREPAVYDVHRAKTGLTRLSDRPAKRWREPAVYDVHGARLGFARPSDRPAQRSREAARCNVHGAKRSFALMSDKTVKRSREPADQSGSRIGIFGSALSYAGSSPRITSEPIGRDINPLGRGSGMALVGGELNLGRIAPRLPLSKAAGGTGSSVNNSCCGGGGALTPDPSPEPPPGEDLPPGDDDNPWVWRSGDTKESYCARLQDCMHSDDPYTRKRCHEAWDYAIFHSICGWRVKRPGDPPTDDGDQGDGDMPEECPIDVICYGCCSETPCAPGQNLSSWGAVAFCKLVGATNADMPTPRDFCTALVRGEKFDPCDSAGVSSALNCILYAILDFGLDAFLISLRNGGAKRLADLIEEFMEKKNYYDIIKGLLKEMIQTLLAILIDIGLYFLAAGLIGTLAKLFLCLKCTYDAWEDCGVIAQQESCVLTGDLGLQTWTGAKIEDNTCTPIRHNC